MLHHARLRQCEAGEHADGVQLDQRGGVAFERDDQQARDHRQDEHPVREHQPVATVRQLARQIPVAGDDRTQPREVGERGVGREDQDRKRGDLYEEVEERPLPEDGTTHDGQQRLRFRGEGMQSVREE